MHSQLLLFGIIVVITIIIIGKVKTAYFDD